MEPHFVAQKLQSQETEHIFFLSKLCPFNKDIHTLSMQHYYKHQLAQVSHIIAVIFM